MQPPPGRRRRLRAPRVRSSPGARCCARRSSGCCSPCTSSAPPPGSRSSASPPTSASTRSARAPSSPSSCWPRATPAGASSPARSRTGSAASGRCSSSSSGRRWWSPALYRLSGGDAGWPPILVVVFMLGFNYGTNLAVFPAACKDYFGIRNFGLNYGCLFAAFGSAGLIMPWVNGFIEDRTGSQRPLLRHHHRPARLRRRAGRGEQGRRPAGSAPRRRPHPGRRDRVMAIVTISRGSFSGGVAVAEAVAERLGVPCISREVVRDAAQASGVDEGSLRGDAGRAAALLGEDAGQDPRAPQPRAHGAAPARPRRRLRLPRLRRPPAPERHLARAPRARDRRARRIASRPRCTTWA